MTRARASFLGWHAAAPFDKVPKPDCHGEERRDTRMCSGTFVRGRISREWRQIGKSANRGKRDRDEKPRVLVRINQTLACFNL